jgi:hypothetical protein
MTKQTAVNWLLEELKKVNYPTEAMIMYAKKLEKQQIIDAWNGGDYAYFCSKETGRDFADGTEYYNETYGSKKIKFTEEEWVELNNESKENDENLIDAINMARNEPDMSGDDIIFSLTKSKPTSSQTEPSTKELEDFLQWIEEETFFKHGTTRLTAQPTKLFTHTELVELYNQDKL